MVHTNGITNLAQQALGRLFLLFLLGLGRDVVTALGLLGGLIVGHFLLFYPSAFNDNQKSSEFDLEW